MWYHRSGAAKNIDIPKGVTVKKLSSSYFVITDTRKSRSSKTRKSNFDIKNNSMSLEEPVRHRRRKRSGDLEQSTSMYASRPLRTPVHHRIRTRTRSNKKKDIKPLPMRIMQLRLGLA